MNFNKEYFFNYDKKDIVIIISRKVTFNMYRKYSSIIKNNTLFFISDKPSEVKADNIISFDNKELINNGFTNMHSKYKVSAWDKSIYFIKQIFNKNDNYNYWIIEDDCYLRDDFENYLNSFKTDNTDMIFFGWYITFPEDNWYHWSNTISKYFIQKNNLCGSLNQTIRLSPLYLQNLFKFQKKNNILGFHEIIFPSICKKYNMKKKVIKHEKIKMAAYPIKNFETIKKVKNNNMLLVHPLKKWYN